MPLLVGGTMLYFNALREGLSDLPESDPELRAKIIQEGESVGWPAMHERLKTIDPESYNRLKPNDKQRIGRVLEVYTLTGQPMSQHWTVLEGAIKEPIIAFGLCPDSRQNLHDRIARRWYELVDQGLIDEVKQLKARGDLSLNDPSMRCVGYRQVWEYLEGAYNLETLHQRAIVATRRLAKRQITWLRSWPDLIWFDRDASDLESQLKLRYTLEASKFTDHH